MRFETHEHTLDEAGGSQISITVDDGNEEAYTTHSFVAPIARQKFVSNAKATPSRISHPRASARPSNNGSVCLAHLVHDHDTLVVVDSLLSDHLALLVRASKCLLLFRLRLLLRPFLADGVFSRVFHRVVAGVVAAAIAFEAGGSLSEELD